MGGTIWVLVMRPLSSTENLVTDYSHLATKSDGTRSTHMKSGEKPHLSGEQDKTRQNNESCGGMEGSSGAGALKQTGWD
jgi:hypothetical protein